MSLKAWNDSVKHSWRHFEQSSELNKSISSSYSNRSSLLKSSNGKGS